MGFDYPTRETSERFSKALRILLVILVALFVIWSVTSQSLWIWLNVLEFGELFVRPFVFEFYGGLILSMIALARIDMKNYVNGVAPVYLDFRRFKLSPLRADVLLRSYLSSWSQGKYEEAGKYLDQFIKVWNIIVEARRRGGG